MDLATLLQMELVKAPLEALDKEEAIAELVELLVRAGKVEDRDALLDVLYEREAKGSTGIGGGVAIPHARFPGIGPIALAAGVSRDGIEFDAADGELVYLVFLVLADAHNPGPNVELLCEIGYLMQVPGVYEGMVAAQEAEALIQVIRNVRVEQ